MAHPSVHVISLPFTGLLYHSCRPSVQASASVSYPLRDFSDLVWWCTPLMPALRRQRQVEPWEFQASLVYVVSSRASQGYTGPQDNEKGEGLDSG